MYHLSSDGHSLAEMLRRFVLVGLFVVGPYHRGSIMQIAVATFFCILYLFAQQQVQPYRR